jgi:hypothetical protein
MVGKCEENTYFNVSNITHSAFFSPGRETLMFNSTSNLAFVRQSKGITLEQIANSTKISIRYLRAIEEGRLAVLPGGVYSANYLRQYAEAIESATSS